VPIADCVTQAIAVVEPLLRQRGQRVAVTHPDRPVEVWADPDRLTQVLINLLMNASAYGPFDQPIAVGVRVVASQVETRVTDQGSGLEPGEEAYIFERYVRGDAGARRKNGLGLGLYIVKAFVESQGGVVGVDTQPGKGASFWFRLPATVAATPVSATPVSATLAAGHDAGSRRRAEVVTAARIAQPKQPVERQTEPATYSATKSAAPTSIRRLKVPALVT
jgi:signal transduction histidine kinase